MKLKRPYSILFVFTASLLILSGCKGKKHEEIDLSSIHTSAVSKETLADETSSSQETSSVPEDSSKAEGSSSKDKETIAQISSQIQTYHPENNKDITLSYPIVSNMTDSQKQEEVNQLLKSNVEDYYHALTNMEVPASMEVTCRVESLDRNRLTAVYTGSYLTEGAAYPVNLFFSNTVDLQQVKSLGLNDYSDAYTMAGYLKSDDVQFYQAGAELTKALLEYRAEQTIEDYTALLNQADFPLMSAASAGKTAEIPQSFSYLSQSVLYFSIPVPHALGDYAIVAFPMDGK